MRLTNWLLQRRYWVLAGTVALLLAVLPHALNFYLDASEDSLVVQGDPDVALANLVSERFGVAPFLVVTWSPPDGNPFTPEALRRLTELRAELRAVDGVIGVTTMLDVPLLRSPPVPLEQLLDNMRTLQDSGVDVALARQELTHSPVFSNLLVSADGRASAVQVVLRPNTAITQLRASRDAAPDASTRARRSALVRINQAYYAQQQRALIDRIKTISAALPGTSHVGGVPMIAVDLIRFVENDLLWFGGSAAAIVTLMLWLFFRRLRWLVIPLLTSVVTGYLTVALLGALSWPVTVVSSNFLSLLLITTVSLNIHLIVRYRELLANQGDRLEHAEMIRQTMSSKLVPCVYTTVTTMVAFSSLLTASIVPVEHFGAMMAIGVAVSLLVTLVLFPVLLMVFTRGAGSVTLRSRQPVIQALSALSVNHAPAVVGVALAVAVGAAVGLTRLSLDNSFVEYFHESSDIFTSLHYIDQHLGGTMPVDVIVQMEPLEVLDEDDDFASADSNPQDYWFTPERIAAAETVHQVLAAQAHTGKVLSLASLHAVARELNDGQNLSALELAAVISQMPDDVRSEMIYPYADPLSGQLRISARIRETDADLVHRTWLQDLQQALAATPYGAHTQVSGLLVLYNNMLANMFTSQLNTLGYVLGLTALMFAVLFRSLRVAVLALIPNATAAVAVIGSMGWLGVPLDLMTLTIAAISIGIGVDDAIHYVHRFREERNNGSPVGVAIRATHESVGRALYFTSLTMVAGFSVLVLSNFYPTIYFGLFTSLAMALALFANMTVLPALLRLTERDAVETLAA